MNRILRALEDEVYRYLYHTSRKADTIWHLTDDESLVRCAEEIQQLIDDIRKAFELAKVELER